MSIPISVVIPVGPLPRHTEHLRECLDSVLSQVEKSDQILVLDNGIGLRDPIAETEQGVDWHRIPWAIGLASGYNYGIAIARHENCFMLGSDDKLLLNCLKRCREASVRENHAIGWYYVGVEYSDGRTQNTACMAALVSKTLWRRTGGYELGSDYGVNSLKLPVRSCEHIVLSKMMTDPNLGRIVRVSDELLYWVRLRENYYTQNPLE
jgi:glycosyltransferase involved in cell wall biosynthesis